MVVFGGFANGVRVNDIIKFSFADLKWSKVEISEIRDQPCSRSGHSAVVYHNAMYVFGGKDGDNNKLNDLWRLDFSTYSW